MVETSSGTEAEEYTYSYAGVANQDKLEQLDAQSGALGDGQVLLALSSNNPSTFVNPGKACAVWLDNDISFDSSNGGPITPGKSSFKSSFWFDTTVNIKFHFTQDNFFLATAAWGSLTIHSWAYFMLYFSIIIIIKYTIIGTYIMTF